MTGRPWARAWAKLIERASGANLRRRRLAPEMLAGRRGEEAAYWYLRRQGFVMVDRNYRPAGSHGEIDLIGWEGDVLVFVEVKARRSAAIAAPAAAVDWEKQQHLAAAAREYRRRGGLLCKPFRFDIISIVSPHESGGKTPAGMTLEHLRDAFREEPRQAVSP